MAVNNRLRTDPIPVVRQTRELPVRTFTSMKPGRLTPIAAFNLLRMDSCTGRLNLAVEMAETYEILMNNMSVRFTAWFVPHVANKRFERSATIFERAFQGQKKTDDPAAPVVPFIQTHAHPATAGSLAVYKYLGLSAKAGALVNDSYLEGYNMIASFMRRQRSKSLPPRSELDGTLAPALWGSSAFSDVVPDFDDGMIAGELPLTVVSGRLPISGMGIEGNGGTEFSNMPARESTGSKTYPKGLSVVNGGPNNSVVMRTTGTPIGARVLDVYAEMGANSITASLANIDQARKLVSWAKLREQFEGHKDAWIIDTLMSGIEVDDQAWFQPMLLDSQVVQVKQLKRNAMDGASLEEGAANGSGAGSIGVNVPPNTWGGVVMIMAEALPEQLYERQADPWFTAKTVGDLPNYKADVLNPMPVVEVKKKQVDVDHSDPEGLFGYAKRNWQWERWPMRVGGDMFAPTPSAATTVARRSIYATDKANPSLSEEFYASTTLGREVFLDQVADPFKVGLGGVMSITGLTVIGEVYESEANYDEMRAQTPPLVPIKP